MADSSKKDKSKESKVFDVAKPGRSAPTPTGKPIIITNRPVLKDPMVSESPEQAGDTEAPPAPPIAPTASRVKIVPLSHDEGTSDAETPVTDAATTEKKPSETTDAKPDTKPEQEAPTASEPPADQPASSPAESAPPEVPAVAETEPPEDTQAATTDTAEVTDEPTATGPTDGATPTVDEPSAAESADATAEQAATDKEKDASKVDEEAARKEAARAEELHKLAESHRYYLPINEVEKRHRIYAWSALFVLLLAAVWLDIVLDAGIMKLGTIKAPTHFFSVQQPAAPNPAVATKLYVSTTDHVSFSYPSTWKLDKASTNGVDTVEVSPSDPTILVSAALTRNAPFSSSSTTSDPVTLADVTYQQLKSSTSTAPLYLQQFIAEVPSVTNSQKIYYVICYDITTTQLYKSGDMASIPSILGSTFRSPDGKDQLGFYGQILTPTTNPSDGPFTNLSDAENFLKNNQDFKQLKTIMLSLKLPKQNQ